MKTTLSILVIFLCCTVSYAQPEKPDLTKVILVQDSLFWEAYNRCDANQMQQFFTQDIEFYHDKGGLTVGLQNLTTDLKQKLCGNEKFRLRREAIEGTVKVFPLQRAGVNYGAIISGEHVFYVLEAGKSERLDGYGKFTDVWVVQNNVWKMSRVLSYDHGPAPYVNKRIAIKLADNMLDQFAGQYLAPQAGVCNVQREPGLLHLLIGDKKYILYPQSDNLFFVKDRDLTFEFVKDQTGNISKMTVREKGKVVEEAVRKN